MENTNRNTSKKLYLEYFVPPKTVYSVITIVALLSLKNLIWLSLTCLVTAEKKTDLPYTIISHDAF